MICCHVWFASRVDTVHETVPVEHVCDWPVHHSPAQVHHCSCGATVKEYGGV